MKARQLLPLSISFLIHAVLTVSCSYEPQLDLTPAAYSAARPDFERSYFGKSLSLALENGRSYCVRYDNQDCHIWNLDGSVQYLQKVCYVQTSSDKFFYYLDFYCDEKKDGIEEPCSPSEGSPDNALSLMGRMTFKSLPDPEQEQLVGEPSNLEDPSQPAILSLQRHDDPNHCRPE